MNELKKYLKNKNMKLHHILLSMMSIVESHIRSTICIQTQKTYTNGMARNGHIILMTEILIKKKPFSMRKLDENLIYAIDVLYVQYI